MKRFISLSCGVESTTMAILYGKGATAIWVDPGDEEPEMYERVDYVESMLKIIHNGDFELVRITPEVLVKGRIVNTITEAAIRWKFFPSKMARWCTSKFKIEPIDKFLSTQGPCELMIGFNAEEEPGKDRTGNFMACENVTYRYPLHEDGHTRADCEEILDWYGLRPHFPVYMSRGGCRFCMFRRKAELKAKYVFAPLLYAKDEATEMAIQDKNRKKFYAINMSAGSYESVRLEADREISLWGIEAVKEMYKKVESHQPCGAFCHR